MSSLTRLVLAALLAIVGCAPPPGADALAFRDLMAASADGDCAKVFALRDDGFVVPTEERTDIANLIIGICEYRAGRFVRAASTLEQAATRRPPFASTPRAAYYHARALHRANDDAGADAAYSQLLSRFSASRYADDALYHHGRLLLSLDRPDEALAKFATLAAWDGIDDEGRARALYGSARALQLRGELTGVAADLESAAARYAQLRTELAGTALADNALYREGRLRRSQGRCDLARPLFEVMPVDFPASVWVPLAAYHHARCQLDEAAWTLGVEELEAILAAYGESNLVDNALYRLGRAHYARALEQPATEQSDLLAAQRALDQLRAEHPDSLFFRGGSYYAGRAAYRLGAWSEAAARFGDVLAAGPSGYDDGATYYTAMSAFHQAALVAHFLEVAAALDGFGAQFPDSPYLDNAVYFAARATHRTNALADAAARYLVFAADFPTSTYRDNALRYRTLALVDLGRCAEAAETAQLLRLTEPDSPYVAEADTAAQACQ